jgi:hypothetical protein
MADPTTILEYATERSTKATQAMTGAQQRLAAAQTDLAQANIAASGAASVLANLEQKAAEIRQNLSIIVTPADGTALLNALEQTIVRIRAQQAAILKIQARVSAAEADAAQAQADLAAASTESAAAQTALADATQSDLDGQALSVALSTPPLSTLPTRAGKALDETDLVEGAAYKKAKDRIADDLPPKLFQRAHDRRTQTSSLIKRAGKNTADAEDARLKEIGTNDGLTGKVKKLWVAFQRAEEAARNFAGSAVAEFNQAKADLAKIGEPTYLPLTTEQKGRIKDVALQPDREAAAHAEDVIATGVAQDMFDKQVLLDEAVLKAKAEPDPANDDAVVLAKAASDQAIQDYNDAELTWREKETLLLAAFADVDAKQVLLAQAIEQAVAEGNDPNSDPDVGIARGNLTTALTNLEAAKATYIGSDKGRLDLWEAAVPDSTWLMVEQYEEAVETLDAIKNSNPATLKNNLNAAEEAYVTAKLAADKSAGVVAQLDAEQARRTATSESARKSAGARLFSGLRGDE